MTLPKEVLDEMHRKEQIAQRYLFHRRSQGQVQHDPTLSSLREAAMRVGMACWAHSYKLKKEDEPALMGMYEYAKGTLNVDLMAELHTDGGKAWCSTSAKWVECGLPVVRLGAKQASALIATRSSSEAIEMFRSPFGAFLLEYPTDVLQGSDGIYDSVLAASFTRNDGRRVWSYVARAKGVDGKLTAIGLHVHNVEALEFLEEQEKEIPANGLLNLPQTDEDHRIHDCLRRLICNFVLANSSVEQSLKKIGKSHGNERGEPLNPRVYQFVRDVSYDVRQSVKAYVEGDKKSLALQFMVAGHWKMQAHGPNRSLRRHQWIEPYWKGPDDAPIRVGARRA